MISRRVRWPLGALGIVAALIAALAIYESMGTTSAKPPASRTPVIYTRPASSRLDAGEWETVQQVVRWRAMALALGRTDLHRRFAAFVGLQGLMHLRPVLPGRCAVAILYLYDNLRDLLEAYPGENWQPLRLLIAKQPSLQACAPKPAPKLVA